MTDEDALLAAVLAQPEDDLPKLVYADWLDEHGQPERAWLTRDPTVRWFRKHVTHVHPLHGNTFDGLTEVQENTLRDLVQAWSADWQTLTGVAVRHGFVHAVHVFSTTWWGIPCSMCGGYGNYLVDSGHRVNAACPRCSTTGILTLPYGLRMAKQHPVVRVEMSDRVPRDMYPGYAWDVRMPWEGELSSPWLLPPRVHQLLSPVGSRVFATREQAVDALSIAALSWARSTDS